MSHMPEMIWADYGVTPWGHDYWNDNDVAGGTKYIRFDLQSHVDAARLDQVLRDLITEQSEGEWDNELIEKDVKVFSARIIAALVQP